MKFADIFPSARTLLSVALSSLLGGVVAIAVSAALATPPAAPDGLRACPFCGSADVTLEYQADGQLCYVACNVDYARGPSFCAYAWGRGQADAKAVEAWNHRRRPTDGR